MLAHFLKASGQLLNQIHFDIEVYGKVGVLMGGINCSTHIKIDICRFLKKKSTYQRCAVLFKIPFLVKLVVTKVILSVLDDPVHRDNALGNEVDTLDMSYRGNVASLEAQTYLNSLTEIFSRDR